MPNDHPGQPSAQLDLDSDLLPTTTFVDGGPSDTDFNLQSTTPALIPRQVSRFLIRQRLGEGGFGSVFLAYDPTLDRDVALKLPCRQSGWTMTQELAFLNEARIAARLRHPHVATVFEAGSNEQDGVYIAMEFVGGESLGQRLARGKLPVADAVRICGQIAEAMHQGHKLGLVHRDLKPSNIMLDLEGNVKVCDFGLALHEDQQHYKRGDSSGTLSYMSPEQVRGESHHLDGRSDIWSLGVILYECLSGRRPFRGQTPQEVRDEILHRDPKPLRQSDESIPAALDALCRKCLEKNLAERLPTAVDFKQALVDRPLPRRRTWVAALAIAAVLLMVAAVAVLGGLRLGSVPTLAPPEARRNLLTDRPEEVFFSPYFGKNTWSAKNGLLFIDSHHWSLIALDTFSDDAGKLHQLDLSGRAFADPALSGAFWGLHPEAAEDGSPVERCLLLVVEPSGEGGMSAMIRLYHFDIGKGQDLNPTILITHNYGGDVPLDVDFTKPIRIQMDISSGKLARLRVQGQDVELPLRRIPEWKAFASGRFGVVGWNRKITYTRGQLTSP